jgi:hypothetical protein
LIRKAHRFEQEVELKLYFACLAAIVLFSSAAAADQYSCETVDQSAVAYVNTDVPVSKLESGRRCALAIEGATRTGRIADGFRNGVDGLGGLLFAGDEFDDGDLADMLVNVIAGPFIGGDGSGDSPVDERLAAEMNQAMGSDEVDTLRFCLTRFAEAIGPQYDLADVSGYDTIEEGRIQCDLIAPEQEEGESAENTASYGTLRVRFQLDREREFTFLLPVEFARQQRDGEYMWD